MGRPRKLTNPMTVTAPVETDHIQALDKLFPRSRSAGIRYAIKCLIGASGSERDVKDEIIDTLRSDLEEAREATDKLLSELRDVEEERDTLKERLDKIQVARIRNRRR